MEDQKKCKRNGCRQTYLESQNNSSACNFHPGKPIFHDLKKGWTCCQKIVYDWDEFQKIKTCATGFHNDLDDNVANDQSQFYKSSTVTNAQKGIEKFGESGPQNAPRSIDDYNRELEEKRRQQELEEQLKVKQIFITPSGKYKCNNKGCLKEYDPNNLEEMKDDACNYHPGQPVFHDLKKFWTCCKIEKYDWDEFMKIKPCAIGKHEPRRV